MFAGENLFIHLLSVFFRFQPQHDKSFEQKYSFYSERYTAFLYIYQCSRNRFISHLVILTNEFVDEIKLTTGFLSIFD